jgi:microcystin-dependent protein
MSDPYVGQIIAVGFSFAPVGWALCNGQTLQITPYQLLYSLIGTTYGGDGQTSFNLPDLRSRGAIGMGQGPGLINYIIGGTVGTEQVTLLPSQYGLHSHALTGATDATSAPPVANSVLGTPTGEPIYLTSGATTTLLPASVGLSPGGGLPHENRQPFQAINYIIALYGQFPPRQQ